MLRPLFVSRTGRRPCRLKIEALEPREVPAFIPGDIVVLRVGDGSAALTGAATAEFLDEYSPQGTLDLSISLPTSGGGLSMPITASGTDPSEGLLSRSADGRYLVAVGYDAAPGLANVAGSSVPRVIGRMDSNLAIDTTTATTSFSGTDVRSATTVDGTGFWAAGADSGIVYIPFGRTSNGTVVADDGTDNRVVSVFDGQLYATSGSGTNTFKGVNAVGTGTPTTTGNSFTRLPGLTDTTNPSDYSFFLADLNSAVPGDDTLYVADDSAGIVKFSLVGGSWVMNNVIGAGADGYRGLTGAVVGNTVTLYATRQGATIPGLYAIVDTTGYNQNMTATPALVVGQPANEAFGGIAFAPGNVSPVNTLPATFSAAEDTTTALTGISTGDADARSANVQVTFSVGSGTLNLGTSIANGVTGSQVSGNGTGTVVITAPVLAINTTLADPAGLTYTPPANATGNVTLTMTTDDLGNTGGTSTPDTDSATIAINAVNHPPVNSVPGAQNGTEDTPLTFSATNSNAITVSDVDAGGGNEKVTLSVNHGTLTLGSTNSLTVTGNGSVSVTLIGKISDLNTGMDGLVYTPGANYNGADTLTVLTDDQGNTGPGGPKTDTDTVAINLSAVNDPPVNTVPGSPVTTNEDVAISIQGISVADVDAGTGNIKVTFSAPIGSIIVFDSVTNGVTDTQISGNGTGSVTVTAPLDKIDTTLFNLGTSGSGIMYVPAPNANGDVTVTMVTDDQANTGSGGALTDTDTFTVRVNAVDDPPVNSVPGTQSGTEDTPLTFSSANGNLISVSDADAGNGSLKVTLTAGHGTVTLGSTANLSVTGNGSATVVATGKLADLNTGLAGLTFTPDHDYNGSASLQILTDDQGNTGSGGPKTDTDTIAINLSAVNDAPVNNLPATLAATEDTPQGLAGISTSDVDAGSADITVTLSVDLGKLTVATGLSGGVNGGQVSGNGSGSVVITAPVSAINATLADPAGLTYLGASDYSGPDTLKMVTDDQANSGSGGAMSDTDTSALTIAPVADTPSVTNATTDEDTQSATGLVVSRSPADGGEVGFFQITAITNGKLYRHDGTTQINDGDFISFAVGNAGLTFTPAQDFNGTATFGVQASLTNDATGLGGSVVTAQVTVTPVNDPPVNTLPSSFAATEDTPQALAGISSSDVDAGSANVRVTFSVPAGTGTLIVGTGVSGGVAAGQVSGNGTASVVVTAPLAAVNTTLADAAGLTYMPAPDLNGNVTLTMLTDDQGNTGSGNPLTDTDTATINIASVDDPPTVSVPGDQTTAEDTPITFDLAGGNPITVADVDAGTGLKLEITTPHGTTTLSTESHLTVTGEGTGDLVAIGSPADLNAALSGLVYTPGQDFNGSDLIKVAVDDQGNTGIGGPLSTFMNIAVSVTAVNDAPVNVGPVAPTVAPATEDTPFAFAGDFGFFVNDADAGTGDLTTTLTATHGTIRVTDGTGATVTGNGTTQITVTGPLDELNASLAGLTYTPDPNYNGPAAIDVSTDDLGNTGGAARTTNDTFAIDVRSANDAPKLGDYTFSLTGTVSVGDPVGTVTATDVDGDTITYSITGGDPGGNFAIDPSSGQITVASTAGLPASVALTVTATDNGTDDGVPHPLSDTGTVTVNHNTAPTTGGIPDQSTNEDTAPAPIDLSAYFSDNDQASGTLSYAITGNTNPGLLQTAGITGSSLTLVPAADANGSADITAQATDAGGLTVSTTFTFSVTPVNDAPSFTAGGNQTVAEDAGPQTVSGWATGMTAGPPDEAGQALTFQVSTDNDALFSVLPAVDPTTGTLTYTPAANANGSATVTVKLHDNGGTANGGGDSSAGQTFTISVTPVNDVPVIDTSFTPLLPAIKLPIKKGTSPTGGLVSTLTAHDSDVDAGDPKGIAITSVQMAAGTWQYTTDGTNWQAIPAVDPAHALLLAADGTTQVRLLPGAKFKNQYADLTFKAWDQSAGSAGGQVDTTNPADTSIGLQTEYAWVAVGSAKPVVNAAGQPNLTPTRPLKEDHTSAAFTVKKFLGLLAKETDPTKAFGIAVSADAGGNWQFNTGKGGWQPIGAVTDGSALLLRPTDRVRLVPTPNFNGVATLTYHTWDMATGTAGSKTDTAGSGFSAATETAVLTIAPVNDAPVVDPTEQPGVGSVAAGGTTTAISVAAFLAGVATDVDNPSVGIELLPTSAKIGFWQYSTDGGGTWTMVTKATELASTALIQFVTSATAKPGAYSLSFKAWDGTSKGGTALSKAMGMARLTIT